MNSKASHGSHWSTSSFGDSVETSPQDLHALGEHLDLCRSKNTRLFNLRCNAETLSRFLLARIVTTALVLALLLGAVILAF
ncbi:hypothetical protein [Roseateles sp.]|jgi:hypothetical protein|uniref:hypothetical protein n=1 Tax=Roseateles sp. TaxID=1971397 RepID=UPI0037C92B90